MNKKYVIGLIGILCIGLIALALKNNISTPSSPSHKIQVVTSFYPLYFFTSQIAGNAADVSNVTPAGAEPHDYEPTAQDVAKIENSSLLVLNGGGLEAWGGKIKQNIDSKRTMVVTAGEGLTNQQVVEDGKKMMDPHVWLSPLLAEQLVDKIQVGLAQVDPAHASQYVSNAQGLKAKLKALDTEYAQGLATCKEKNIVTSHAAFGYLATNYHLSQVPISGLSPDAEPSPKQLADVAKFAKDNHVHYIFFESLVSPKLSQTVATEIGAQTLVLNPIEGLTSGEIVAGKDYLSEMKNNLTNLKTALSCK